MLFVQLLSALQVRCSQSPFYLNFSLLVLIEIDVVSVQEVYEIFHQAAWPSGLRRWLQAPVRKGVSSNLTAVTFCVTTKRRNRTATKSRSHCKCHMKKKLEYFDSNLKKKTRKSLTKLFEESTSGNQIKKR